MYVVIVYDVDVSRVNKINQFLKQFLYWRQNSVFEGEITQSQLEKIKTWIKKFLKEDDKVIIYILPSKKILQTVEFGKSREIENIL